jgi:hypothetical protein
VGVGMVTVSTPVALFFTNAKQLPFRGLRQGPEDRAGVTTVAKASRGVACAPECCLWSRYRAYWLPDPVMTLPVSRLVCTVFPQPPSPTTFAVGSSSRTLRLSYRVFRVSRPPAN